MSSTIHASVLLREAVEGLAPKDGGVYIDATCGLGGHSEAILEASGPTGRLVSVDRDPEAIGLARARLARFGDRARVVEGDFSDLRAIAEANGALPADGVLADLGVSSLQLDDAKRGFSFSRPGPLDMRMGPRVGQTAAELLESFDVDELTAVLRDFGEIPRAHAVAEAVLRARDEGRLGSTGDLARVIEAASGGKKGAATHPATRAFQAIRIAVNRELEELETLIGTLADIVRPGGRAAIISFHSLEDRMVKHAFEEQRAAPAPRGLPIPQARTLGPWRAITKKPIAPSDEEVDENPRSRSAKLRVAERRAPEEMNP